MLLILLRMYSMLQALLNRLLRGLQNRRLHASMLLCGPYWLFHIITGKKRRCA